MGWLRMILSGTIATGGEATTTHTKAVDEQAPDSSPATYSPSETGAVQSSLMGAAAVGGSTVSPGHGLQASSKRVGSSSAALPASTCQTHTEKWLLLTEELPEFEESDDESDESDESAVADSPVVKQGALEPGYLVNPGTSFLVQAVLLRRVKAALAMMSNGAHVKAGPEGGIFSSKVDPVVRDVILLCVKPGTQAVECVAGRTKCVECQGAMRRTQNCSCCGRSSCASCIERSEPTEQALRVFGPAAKLCPACASAYKTLQAQGIEGIHKSLIGTSTDEVTLSELRDAIVPSVTRLHDALAAQQVSVAINIMLKNPDLQLTAFDGGDAVFAPHVSAAARMAVLMAVKDGRQEWEPDFCRRSCIDCSETLVRRSHCRCCGRVFCRLCASRNPVTAEAIRKYGRDVKLCGACSEAHSSYEIGRELVRHQLGAKHVAAMYKQDLLLAVYNCLANNASPGSAADVAGCASQTEPARGPQPVATTGTDPASGTPRQDNRSNTSVAVDATGGAAPSRVLNTSVVAPSHTFEQVTQRAVAGGGRAVDSQDSGRCAAGGLLGLAIQGGCHVENAAPETHGTAAEVRGPSSTVARAVAISHGRAKSSPIHSSHGCANSGPIDDTLHGTDADTIIDVANSCNRSSHRQPPKEIASRGPARAVSSAADARETVTSAVARARINRRRWSLQTMTVFPETGEQGEEQASSCVPPNAAASGVAGRFRSMSLFARRSRSTADGESTKAERVATALPAEGAVRTRMTSWLRPPCRRDRR